MSPAVRARLQALFVWVAQPVGSPIDMWRRRLLGAVLVGLIILGLIAYVVGAGVAWKQGQRAVVWVDTVAYGMLVVITVGRRLPYMLRATTLVTLPAILGTYLLFRFGVQASGFPWLMSCPILASLLLGLRYGAWALGVTAVLVFGLGALIPTNLMPWTAQVPDPMLMWLVGGSSVLVIASLLSLSVGYLFEGLGQEATARRAAELEADRRQRLAALGTLSGGIAHDFNNLLQPIVSDAEHAQRLIARGEDARPVLDDILRTTDRARTLVRRILSFARPTTRGRDIVDLGELVTESQRLLPALLADNIALDVTIDVSVRVAAEPSELQQVLLNLVNNAAQSMPGGGTVHIVVGLAPASLALEGTVLEGIPRVASLAVIDSGIGMDADRLARIYEPFYTTKGPQEGSGLGLATVHATVTALGGVVRAESAPGRGTRMQVLLPATDALPIEPDAPRGAIEADIMPATTVAPRRRIMVIDDEPAVLAGTARLLERLGYEVARFGDPSAALAQLNSNAAATDIVLTDLAMPGLSGWEVAHLVHTRHPALPVIVMTGHVASPDEEAASHPGVRAVIAKPFTGVELQAALRALA